jgi:hypothetical protein
LVDLAPVAVVRSWQDAANAQDVDRLLALSAPDIEIVGPRGSGRGWQLLRDWLGRAGLHLTTLRTFGRGDIVVLAQRGVWRGTESGEVVGEAAVASYFRVSEGRVGMVARFDNLDRALRDAGLTYADEVASP